MSDFTLSVVIATYNRPKLIIRAVNSVIAQRSQHNNIEVIIVDDASTTTPPAFKEHSLIYHRMSNNGGPGPARMKGLELANSPWVLILDDDDTLKPEAVEYLAQLLPTLKDLPYPVYQFAVYPQNLPAKYHLIQLDDFVQKKLSGEFTPVFHREHFLASGMQYPNNRAGGEHLLWWEIADKFSIPAYNHSLVIVNNDADTRLTHFSSQITHAASHQQLAEIALARFGGTLSLMYPEEYRRIRLAHVIYSLLNNQRKIARQSLNDPAFNHGLKIALWGVSWLPLTIIKKLFLFYRGYRG
ncbi:GalNAc5-diNAcBac-PP-undecaprenol beta-1,3-glucosyltransferase [Providencia alcalifaciens]|nr:GalNAc5-diNAcBac-PP-undecaprenol beta-1,3-glucosyltransferase [Providencia alcalifaciens]